METHRYLRTLLGRPEELTMTTTLGGEQASCAHLQRVSMRLTFEECEVRSNQDAPVITLGRDATNTIVVNDPKVSRLHARIELRKDKFILIDQSTNGTYVTREDGQTANVRRYEILLPESGAIGLGQQATPDDPLAIRFKFSIE